MKTIRILPILLACCLGTSCATGGKNFWKNEKRSEEFRLEVVTGSVTLPVVEHRGRSYIEGRQGERYVLRIHNRSERRIEVVAAVDGRDVIDGQPMDTDKHGYIIEPWGVAEIDGWRTSMSTVAAFRFTSPEDSYSARMGTPGEIGKIKVAVFREKERPRRPLALPYRDDGVMAEQMESEAKAGETADMPASPADRSSRYERRRERSNLGTRFGETRHSVVEEVEFERESSRPAVWLGLRYDDAEGLCEKGIKDFCRRPLRPLHPAAHQQDEDRFSQPPPDWGNHFNPRD